jgi:prepilin-type N-terminal cleavage/methylation domain-containing protein
MDESMSHPNARRESGFTILETLVAMVILSVGLLAIASLFAKTTTSSNMSRYMSTQSLLASEKLDDLNRLPATDPGVAVPAGATAGSLTADASQSVTVGVVTENVDYFDTIQASATNNGVSETFTGVNAGGATTYTTVTHSPNGVVTQATTTAAPVAPPDAITFKRRWIIEKDAPVAGVKRITVVVTVQDVSNTVPFQMSMVRP